MHQDLKAAIQSDAAIQGGTMSSILHGGKTSPKFLVDLNRYNPHRLGPAFSYNVLTELAVTWEGTTLPKSTPSRSCEHRWALNNKQSILPDYDTRPDHSTIFIVSAYCINAKCRCHTDLEVDYRGEGAGEDPCPKGDAPLHHLKYAWVASNDARSKEAVNDPDSWCDIQHFQCSDSRCLARVTTRFRTPRLKKEWVALLSDKSLIKQRAQKAMNEDPVRFEGHAVPSPGTVITNLRTYIMNAIRDPANPRRIQGNNKKWCLSLGEPCADLLLYLGFTRDGVDWLPPCPDPPGDSPSKNPINILLEDVEKELAVLLDELAYSEKYLVTVEHVLADKEFERILGAQGYKKRPSVSRTTGSEAKEEDHPFLGGLGAIADFHDDLISFAYNRQVDMDPANVPYYLECLQGIAKGRGSEDLQTKAVIEASSGKVSRKDIREAYKCLNLEYGSAYLDDDFIIGTFQARISDGPKQEAELRRALRIVGQDRLSSRIEQVASDSVTTYEQALSWLNVTPDIDDGFLISMFSIKVNENPSSDELARKAVSLIADYRNSSALRQWLATGVLGEVQMDVGHAYTRLGVDDRTVDDETILATYNILVEETPSQLPELKRALTTIAESKDSIILKSFLRSGDVSSSHAASEWPVGLENIGNTCYLNSLLQFYFTVKPLRDLVLSFDEYKMAMDDPSLENKRVGSRKVSKREIERAQRFVYELQKLFQNMISAPRAQVTPEQELARLTLMSSSTEEHIRRKSTLSGNRPSLGEIYGRPIYGPLPAPAQVPEATQSSTDVEMVDVSRESQTSQNSMPPLIEIDDISSDGTLVEAPPPETSGDNDFMVIDPTGRQSELQEVQHNKENLPPFKTISSQSSPSEVDLMPLLQQSPTQAKEQISVLPPSYDFSNEVNDVQMADTVSPLTTGPPTRPPPVPPRQKPEEQKKAIQEEVEFSAQQQDVTEVIANVLFQLQCAIKPESIDESGEQIDQVKRLFYGKQKSYTTNEQGAIRTKEEFITDIKVNVASGPRDIYAALDGAFDVQEVEVGGSLEPQYTTISQLPPVLQILVQRVQFDPEKMTQFKVIHHLELKETIHMDRYMDSADPEILRRRQECWKWKKALAALEVRREELKQTELSLEMPEVLAATGEYLAQLASLNEQELAIDDGLLKSFETGAKVAKQEISALEDEIKTLSTNISTQFTDLRTLPYNLHSVFIHRGLVNSGHYWIYIYDFATKIWRKYNDGYVTKVEDPQREIYEAEASARPATPYFLVYVKDDLKDELVDAVCRDVPPPPEKPATIRPGPAIQIDEPQDTVMQDNNQGYKDEKEVMSWVGNGAYEEPGETQEINPHWNNSRTLAYPDTW